MAHDELPMISPEKMVSFHGKLLNNQRVHHVKLLHYNLWTPSGRDLGSQHMYQGAIIKTSNIRGKVHATNKVTSRH